MNANAEATSSQENTTPIANPLAKKFHQLQAELGKQIIGQSSLLEQMVICLLCGGHMLLAGMPGLA